MEKFYTISAKAGTMYKTYEEAVEAASRKAVRDGYDQLFIMESVAVAKTPAPVIEVTKL